MKWGFSPNPTEQRQETQMIAKVKKRAAPTTERQIEARMRFLRKVAIFVIMITDNRGKVQKKVRSFHTSIVGELRNFADFSFKSHTGQTSQGGNSVEVYYHPKEVYEDTSTSPTLEFHWQTEIEKCTVGTFDNDYNWQQALQKVMRNWKSIAKKIDSAEKNRAANAMEDRRQEEKRQRIAKDAKRLSIS
ncbi:hypothetical protein EXS57_02775 [Candidatus Kaiserbacteria bacterium]|nr:hypothetical protein [Candidatus Kaiserbacteria bacterium]